MVFLIVPFTLIAAVVAWLIGRRLLARTGLPVRNILYADVGSSFPQSESLTSLRYGLIGKPDYLVRLAEGIAPIEVKSCLAPASGALTRATSSSSRLTACSWKTFSAPMSHTDWSTTRTAAFRSTSLRRFAQVCLRFSLRCARPRTARNFTSTIIGLENAGRAVSVRFAERTSCEQTNRKAAL